MIPHVSVPTPGNWSRFAWSSQAAPGDKLEPAHLGRDPATVTASITGLPAGAKVRFQHSADGRRGWTDLDSQPAAFFKHRPGDTYEWRGLTGYLRPVLESKSSGPIAISVTVAPQEGVHSMTGAVA